MATSDPVNHWQLDWDPIIKVWYPVPPLSWTQYETPEDVYFDSLDEAFEWIEEELKNAPVVDENLVDLQRNQVELETVSPSVPVAEPPRKLSRGETVIRNPIASQPVTQSRSQRLAEYQSMVGLR
ncbi:hypothetical protein [Mycobacterium phage Azrael100]|nr:hypothetical protein [Mycobacterium phage Azrael100]